MKPHLIRSFVVVILSILLVYKATDGAAQSGRKRTLLALSKGDHTLALVDPTSLKVIARVPVGPDPHEVIASDDGKTAYVSNTGGGQSYEINVIDLLAQKALSNIDTRPLTGPHGIAFAVGKVWFSAEGAKAVGRYDPTIGKLDWSMGTGQDRTHMVYVTQDGKRVYAINISSGSVSILADTLFPAPPFPGAQPRRDWLQTLVQVSKGSEGFDVSSDGRQLWTVSAQDGAISVVDLVNKKLAYVIDTKALGANRLQITPDGKRVLISSLRIGDLFVYDIESRKEVKRINIGHGAAGLLMDGEGSRAFVACTPDNYVAVIDLKTLEVVGHMDVGPGPDGLAWAVQR